LPEVEESRTRAIEAQSKGHKRRRLDSAEGMVVRPQPLQQRDSATSKIQTAIAKLQPESEEEKELLRTRKQLAEKDAEVLALKAELEQTKEKLAGRDAELAEIAALRTKYSVALTKRFWSLPGNWSRSAVAELDDLEKEVADLAEKLTRG